MEKLPRASVSVAAGSAFAVSILGRCWRLQGRGWVGARWPAVQVTRRGRRSRARRKIG